MTPSEFENRLEEYECDLNETRLKRDELEKECVDWSQKFERLLELVLKLGCQREGYGPTCGCQNCTARREACKIADGK
jgi:hypothetical protein